MMQGKSAQNLKKSDDFAKLRKDVADMKLLMSDYYSGQIEINCNMRAEMDIMKLKMKKMSIIIKQLKLQLIKRGKVQKTDQIKISNETIKNYLCQCGRKIDLSSLEKVENQSDNHQRELNIEEAPIDELPPTDKSNEVYQYDLLTSRNLSPPLSEAASFYSKENEHDPLLYEMESTVSSSVQSPALSLTDLPSLYNYNQPKDPVKRYNPRKRPTRNHTQKQKGSMPQSVTYTPELWSLVGRYIPIGGFSYPLERLDSSAQYLIKSVIGDDLNIKWNEMLQTKTNEIWSLPILLPIEFRGLIIRFCILPQSTMEDRIRIELHTPHWLIENQRKELPVVVCLQVRIPLANGEARFQMHTFTIKRLHGAAQPNSFQVSVKGCNKTQFPQIMFLFLK